MTSQSQPMTAPAPANLRRADSLPADLPADLLADLPSARRVSHRAFARGLRPPPRVSVADWAVQHRQLAQESSPRPGRWTHELTPYLVEPMECLSPHHPCERVSVKKGAQLGFTDIGINWLFAIADVYGGPAMVVQPTIDMLRTFEKTKLGPSLHVTARLAGKVEDQKQRDGSGSTVFHKRFPGGFWTMTGANSSSGLQMLSAQYLLKDELSEWPEDVGGRGDPSDQAEERTSAYSDSRKIYQPSTPATDGHCRISSAFEAGDQRRRYLPCPQCGAFHLLEWENVRWDSDNEPGTAHMVAPCCGGVIENRHRRAMQAGGVWVKCWPERDGTKPPPVIEAADIETWLGRDGGGRQPSFHLSQLHSPFVSLEQMVRKYLTARSDPTKLKTFTQQVLGEAYREAGTAPAWEHLYQTRRQECPLLVIPPGGLLLTAGVDVQKDHFVYEVVAWGVGKTSWSIDFGKVYVEDTADLACWVAVDEILSRTYPDWQGRQWGHDLLAVDTGYNTQTVYQWTRRRHKTMATDGRDGAHHPAVGQARRVDITVGGKTMKQGARFWPIGTWPLKAEFYGQLRKEPDPEAPEALPVGFCHFSEAHTAEYFEEVTAEYLTTARDKRTGRTRQHWKASGPNHYLDCRVMAMAAAERLGYSRWTVEQWQKLVAERGAPAEQAQRDLFALWSSLATPAAKERAAEEAAERAAQGASDAATAAAEAVATGAPAAAPTPTPTAKPAAVPAASGETRAQRLVKRLA